jgi:hypothetical protein
MGLGATRWATGGFFEGWRGGVDSGRFRVESPLLLVSCGDVRAGAGAWVEAVAEEKYAEVSAGAGSSSDQEPYDPSSASTVRAGFMW